MARGRVPGYAISQRIRKRIEESFGYIKSLLDPREMHCSLVTATIFVLVEWDTRSGEG